MNYLKVLTTLALALFSLSACSPTVVTQSWKDESFSQPLGKMLILGVSENDTARRAFEQTLSQKLKEHGIHAEPGYTLLPSNDKHEKDEVLRVARKNNIETVLITRVASTKRMKENRTDVRGDIYYGPNYRNNYYPSHPDYKRDWYDYYGRHRADAYTIESSSYTVEWLELGIESSLYLLEENKLVWSASLISDSDGMSNTIDSVTSTLAKQMKKDGVYAK